MGSVEGAWILYSIVLILIFFNVYELTTAAEYWELDCKIEPAKKIL